MRIPLTSLLIAVALLVSACGSDADEPTSSSSTTQASAETTEGDTSTTVGAQTTGSIGDTVVPATTTPALPADPGFTASLDDPVYTDLILDCVYGENEAGSCEQLTGAGLDAADAYGLGNSLSQAPNEAMRDDCIAGGIGCAELNARVRSAIEASDTTTLLCFFHENLTSDEPDDIDAFYEGELLGPDAPAAVADALFTLVEDPTNAGLIATVDGYVGPICA